MIGQPRVWSGRRASAAAPGWDRSSSIALSDRSGRLWTGVATRQPREKVLTMKLLDLLGKADLLNQIFFVLGMTVVLMSSKRLLFDQDYWGTVVLVILGGLLVTGQVPSA